jgi:membrane-associated phospholipid phosphatase
MLASLSERRLAMTLKKVLTALAAVVALAVPGTASADVVTDWNKTLVDALLVARTPPQPGTRIGAIVQTSVFDAVNGIRRRYTQFHPEVLTTSAPRGASAPAAAAGAAHTALVALFPAQKATFDDQLAATLATLSDEDGGMSTAVRRGLEWGATAAEAILAWRGSDDVTGALLPPYVVEPLPSWQPTPPSPPCLTPVARQFATMAPWSMTSPSAFLPQSPPALSSARYAQDFNEVKAIGSAATTPDLADEAATARFWAARFDTPVTMWNRAARSLAVSRDVPLVYNARFFALVNVSLADAVIAVYNAKNTYNTWRPITAIQNADIDGNDATIADPSWTPLLTTPCHQEYPSGHSGLSTAAATVLAAFFGDHTTFTVSSDALLDGGTRTYSSFSEAIDEIALARVAAGIHFRFACEAAQQMGEGLADYAMANELLVRAGND